MINNGPRETTTMAQVDNKGRKIALVPFVFVHSPFAFVPT